MSEVVTYRQQGNIAILQLDNPPINGLSNALRQGILDNFVRAIADDRVAAIVIISASTHFCGGADIREFGSESAYAEPTLGDLCIRLEESQKPVLAAISGVALGGGFELALACDYRLATPTAKFALPEVNLGIIPGAGGTQRLPRLASVEFAMEMILTAKTYSAAEMQAEGVIDHICDDATDLPGAAIAYAQSLLDARAPVKNCAEISVACDHLPAGYFADTQKQLLGRGAILDAHNEAVRAIEAACQLPYAEGLAFQENLVKECMDTPQARALQHLFFAEKETTRIPGLGRDSEARSITAVAVIGAGTMGSGIAINFLQAGLPVTLIDSNPEALALGTKQVAKSIDSSVRKGRLSKARASDLLKNLASSAEIQAAASADLVIEAVIESMEVKRAIFKSLGEICKPTAVLATNTSTLNVNEIAAASKRAENCLGMHFFSPAQVMKLLELVRGEKTSEQTLKTALQLARTIGKIPVVAGVCWGFIGNRMVETYGREVARLILEGATPAKIDAVLENFGLPMGLPTMLDMAGMDVGFYVRQGNRELLYDRDPSYAAIYDRLFELGRFGQKTGRGFYRYPDGAKVEDEDAILEARELARKFGIDQREISNEEILERCMFALINEGARILEDGIALRSGDIDVVYCYGYGYPRYRGGPMQYADELGADHVLARVTHYRDTLGDYGKTWFQPADLLQKLSATGKHFRDFAVNT